MAWKIYGVDVEPFGNQLRNQLVVLPDIAL